MKQRIGFNYGTDPNEKASGKKEAKGKSEWDADDIFNCMDDFVADHPPAEDKDQADEFLTTEQLMASFTQGHAGDVKFSQMNFTEALFRHGYKYQVIRSVRYWLLKTA